MRFRAALCLLPLLTASFTLEAAASFVEAVAVSVTGTAAKGAEQVEPQTIPPGLDVTEPEPLPVLVTVTVLPR
jgi:hypothetical protein